AASEAPARAAARPAAGGANKLVEQVRQAYAQPQAKTQTRGGFKLDLSAGGPDAHDAQFERAS
ncbi:hypothetical protein CH338_25275, partial [Rhodoplanes elegans]